MLLGPGDVVLGGKGRGLVDVGISGIGVETGREKSLRLYVRTRPLWPLGLVSVRLSDVRVLGVAVFFPNLYGD